MRLSIVVPVYNEVATIASVIERVWKEPLPGGLAREIVVVDDGSHDGTRDVLDEIEKGGLYDGLRVIRNQGKGASLRAGFAAATGDIVLVQDADFEYDPSDYGQLIAPILDGYADVVFGSRFAGGGAHRVLFFWHMIGNRLLTLLSNAVTDLNLSDMETGYKVFRREVLHAIQIESNRFGVEPELTSKVALGGWRVYEVPISYHGRTYAEGKKIGWKDGVQALYCIGRFGLLARVARFASGQPARPHAPLSPEPLAPKTRAETPAPAASARKEAAVRENGRVLGGE
jgi:glycosyltransferase involved in cell wall biosynthesis